MEAATVCDVQSRGGVWLGLKEPRGSMYPIIRYLEFG